MFDVAISHNHRIGLLLACVLRPACTPCNHWPLCSMPVMMVAGLCNFITNLDKIMASQQVVIAILRRCIIGLGLFDVLPIGTITAKN